MRDVAAFGPVVLIAALVAVAAVLTGRFGERLRLPAPAVFLVCAAAAGSYVPGLAGVLPIHTAERVTTVALVVILFDGGMRIGWRRFRSAAGPILWLGVLGTFLTAGALAFLAHAIFGFAWPMAFLLGTALSPTDPAVVFSVLGRREVAGRSGTILEGESAVNDPVGIALMVSLLAATAHNGHVVTGVLVEFSVQMVVGAAVGVAGGVLLLAFMRHVPLPNEGLYVLRALGSAFVLYGAATVAGGSGFLAVFVAGIVVGDARAPYKAEIERFHASLASLGEIVVFITLGLTVSLRTLPNGGAWLVGLVLAALLAFVVRPVLVGLLALPLRLRWGERAFVLWAGLRGAVPILLGTFVVAGHVPGATLLYDVVFVVVTVSVVVQGGLAPYAARRLGVPTAVIAPEPWTLGVRFRHEPRGVRRLVVTADSAAHGRTVAALGSSENVWVSLVIRDGRLVPVRADTVLASGDELILLADEGRSGGEGGVRLVREGNAGD